ncbi:hypothetical protein L3X38_025504 [Prunus dulcis]|uniref:RNase H type-1 domain-containing protein n=1 Tax=Prunus dulcis TaxID=3755 RepID=A0AAD4W4C5_PRUDU|nr:hypothetical protein L3X38_025504 [Prunus dulcis]
MRHYNHPDGTLLEQAITLGLPASNNEADYEAMFAGLHTAKELSIKKLATYSDSQLIINQASKEYMAKNPRMIQCQHKERIIHLHYPTNSSGRKHTCRCTCKSGIIFGYLVQMLNSGQAP